MSSFSSLQEWREGETDLGAARNESGRGRGRGRYMYGIPAAGAENAPPLKTAQREKDRTLRSLLSWHPRIPLYDITAIMREIENMRAGLEEIEGQIRFPPDQLLPGSETEERRARSGKSEDEISVSGAQLERRCSLFFSKPANKAESERKVRTLMSMR